MIWMLAACQSGIPDRVLLSGVVFDDLHDQASPISEATITTLGPDYGDAIGEATSDGRGWFEVEVIAGGPMYVTVEAEGSLATGFAGMADIADFEVADGAVWARSESDMDEIRAEFDGCPSLDQPGGVIEGEVRVYLPGYEIEGDEWPLSATAYVNALDSSGAQPTTTCYLDDDGFYSEEAEVTGSTGRFAVFGSPTGAVTLQVGYSVDGELVWATTYYVHVPEQGTAPLYPLYVELPQ
jgi:hypothetical protein